ncbi:MAG: hypothetical protein K0S09_1344 [Sphingobacteriaceae bacterium]|nr:hypothetical protein [Sphingobacteriaceae bacterium]
MPLKGSGNLAGTNKKGASLSLLLSFVNAITVISCSTSLLQATSSGCQQYG